MNITTFLSFFKIEVSNFKFAGKNITNNNFFFSFDFGGHFKINKWQAFNAPFLLFEFFFLISVIRENEFVKCLTLWFFHGAVLIQSFTIKTSLHSFACGLIEKWKLLESIFVNPATLHNILAKLYDSHDIFSCNFLWRLVHFVHLT